MGVSLLFLIFENCCAGRGISQCREIGVLLRVNEQVIGCFGHNALFSDIGGEH